MFVEGAHTEPPVTMSYTSLAGVLLFAVVVSPMLCFLVVVKLYYGLGASGRPAPPYILGFKDNDSEPLPKETVREQFEDYCGSIDSLRMYYNDGPGFERVKDKQDGKKTEFFYPPDGSWGLREYFLFASLGKYLNVRRIGVIILHRKNTP